MPKILFEVYSSEINETDRKLININHGKSVECNIYKETNKWLVTLSLIQLSVDSY